MLCKIFEDAKRVIIEDKAPGSIVANFLFILSCIKEGKKITVFLNFPEEIVIPTVENLSETLGIDKEKLGNLTLFFTVEDFTKLKSMYGIDFLKIELEKIVNETRPDIIYFVRLDTLFSPGEELYISDFVKFLTDRLSINSKLVVSFRRSTKNIESRPEAPFLIELFDLSLIVEEEKEGSFKIHKKQTRSFELTIYRASIDKEKKGITLIETFSNTKDKPANILLISSDEYIIKLHRYILSKNCKLETAKTPEEALLKISSEYDITIYYPFSKQNDFSICKLKENKNLKFPIIYISPVFLKNMERSQASKLGCLTFSVPFSTEEYTGTIEGLLSRYVANHYGEVFKNNKIACSSLKEIKETVNTLLNHRLFFSYFVFKTNERVDSKKLAEFLRDTDKVFVKEGKIHVIAYDMWKVQAEILFNRFKTYANEIELIESTDAVDLFWREKDA
ncbi:MULTISPECIES: hypothetical protein [unclassified Desulfurobacterium]|uniref:hypothetical protein n=1 Tax=Desulfurobacterium sp. TC5-1 TaxID=1158318 RepID=UPI0003B5849E|nr:hypothetical protein [Desulfurobacterium sp. TC5-1]